MDPNRIIQALKGTIDPKLRLAAENELNQVREGGRKAEHPNSGLVIPPPPPPPPHHFRVQPLGPCQGEGLYPPRVSVCGGGLSRFLSLPHPAPLGGLNAFIAPPPHPTPPVPFVLVLLSDKWAPLFILWMLSLSFTHSSPSPFNCLSKETAARF